MRVVEVMSAHIELDVNVSLLAAQRCSVGHMFPAHAMVRDAQLFKSFLPKQLSVFPRLSDVAVDAAATLDVVEWMCSGRKWIDVPMAPSPPAAPTPNPTATYISRHAPQPLTLITLVATPVPAARLQFLMSLLKERAALTTAPVVFALSDHLSLDSGAHEAMLREHVVLLYERGEDSRAWECVPRLDDGVCMATVMIAIGRTRLGLFLHALESKHAAKYAQLVSAVPAAAWQWLSKAKPPHVIIKNTGSSSSSASASAPSYLLSTAAVPAGHAPLHLILGRAVSIKQKASDIDIHATFTLLKRANAILQHAVVAAAGGAATASSAAVGIIGEQFGREGDNSDATREQQPVRYARAYCSQLVDIAVMVVKGIGSRA